MKDIDAARALLRKAQNDLSALNHMRDEEAFSEDIFGFHMQQVIEKTLKAWLALLGETYPKTHDINFLLRLLERAGQEIARFEDFVEYNMYAVQFRYEEYDMTDQVLDRAECAKEAMSLFNHVNGIFEKSILE